MFVEELKGSYSGVVGLPLFETAALLARCGIPRMAHGTGGLMKREEILINATSTEVRAALVDSGVLQEVQIERASRVGLVSNIYKGKVSRVLPGMQAAFVELGLERTAFLHASDIARNPHAEPAADDVEPDIREFVREGQELLVQVLKEPLGTKGARLTTYIAIPSRYLVLTPNSVGIGVSSRIEDELERERLRCVVEEIKAGGAASGLHHPHGGRGRIARGAAGGPSVPAQALAVDRGEGRAHAGRRARLRGLAAAAARAARLVEPRHRARARRFRGHVREAQGIRRALRAAAQRR